MPAACVTTKDRPPTVTVPVLVLAVPLAALLNATDAGPVPLVGLNVSHETSAEAVHAQLASVTSTAEPAPPAADCDIPVKVTA